MDTLFAPVGPLPPDLEPYRVWIWLQIVALRAYVRAVKGRGVLFSTLIDRHGNVTLNWIEKAPEALKPDPFSFTPSKACQAAFTDLAPAHPGENRDLVARDAGEHTCPRQFTPNHALPRPDP